MLRWSFIGFYGAADEIGLPVPGVQIVERGRKIHEEKKNEGRLERERGRNAFSRSDSYLESFLGSPRFRLLALL